MTAPPLRRLLAALLGLLLVAGCDKPDPAKNAPVIKGRPLPGKKK